MKINRLNNKFIFISVTLVVVSFIFYKSQSSKKTNPVRQPALAQSIENVQKNKSPINGLSKKKELTSSSHSNQFVRNYVVKQSLKMNQVVEDPRAEQEKLKNFAQGLSVKQMKILSEMSLDKSISNDVRFLSVYILSLSNFKEAFVSLLEIANAPIKESPSAGEGRLFSEENILRAQALEGIAKLKPVRLAILELKKYIGSQDNVFLIRTAERLLRKL